MMTTSDVHRAPGPYVLIYTAAAAVLVLAVVLAASSDHMGTPSLHTLTEVVATTIAFMAGGIAIVRYEARRDLPYLFLGVGFLGAAVFDGFHAWTSSVYAYQAFPSSIETLSLWGWTVSRLYLGAMAILAGWAWWWGAPADEGPPVIEAPEVFVVSAAIALGVFAIFFLVPLPSLQVEIGPFGRPHEFVAGLLYIVALAGVVAMIRRGERGEHALVLSLITAIVLHLFVTPFSHALWDPWFDVGHLLKILSYGVLLVGLLINVNTLHRTVLDEERRLVETNERLENEIVLRSRAEATAAEEKTLLQSIFESISDGIAVADEQGNIIRANGAAAEIMGADHLFIPADQLVERLGLYQPDETTPMDLDDLPLVRALHGEVTDNVPLFVRHPGRPEGMHLSVSGRPLVDPAGRIRGGVAIFRDVTTEQRVQEQLRRYTAELERRNRDLQDFATIVSHDLKEPLRKVLAFGERLETRMGSDAPDVAYDYLRRMRQGADRMRTLVDDLLAYTRLGEKEHVEQIDLKEVALRARSDLEARIQETGGDVIIHDLGTVECDPAQMYHVFINLIGNGLKYHRDGTAPRVVVFGTTREDACHVTVEDNGIGFEMRYAERIFRPFHRLHARSEYEGSGIGLAIVRKVVEHHGGTIEVDSAPGQGARFTIHLPVTQRNLEVGPLAH